MTREEWIELAKGLEHASRTHWQWASSPEQVGIWDKAGRLSMAQTLSLAARDARQQAA